MDYKNTPLDDIEVAISQMWAAFYRLRKQGDIQKEYESMGIIIKMLTEDRAYIKENFKIVD